MDVVRTLASLRQRRGAMVGPVGVVPTMGYLHAGHISLVERSRADCASTIVTLFVNPTQFGPNEDLSRYPRDFERDRELCAAAGVDLLWAPESDEMYPPGLATVVDVGGPAVRWEGEHRPGHFRGVATVVAKLFLQTRPDRAYFGEKDFQQLAILERMARDLDVPVKIARVPTVRERDGLAMSSRNAYLSEAERKAAPRLRAALLAGAKAGRGAEAAVRRALSGSGLRLQYASLVDADTLLAPTPRTRRRRLLAAAYLGRTRLIDNVPA